ncbi:His-rich protein BRANT [Afipia sp. TerB]
MFKTISAAVLATSLLAAPAMAGTVVIKSGHAPIHHSFRSAHNEVVVIKKHRHPRAHRHVVVKKKVFVSPGHRHVVKKRVVTAPGHRTVIVKRKHI